jgi:hypothetical protein
MDNVQANQDANLARPMMNHNSDPNWRLPLYMLANTPVAEMGKENRKKVAKKVKKSMANSPLNSNQRYLKSLASTYSKPTRAPAKTTSGGENSDSGFRNRAAAKAKQCSIGSRIANHNLSATSTSHIPHDICLNIRGIHCRAISGQESCCFSQSGCMLTSMQICVGGCVEKYIHANSLPIPDTYFALNCEHSNSYSKVKELQLKNNLRMPEEKKICDELEEEMKTKKLENVAAKATLAEEKEKLAEEEQNLYNFQGIPHSNANAIDIQNSRNIVTCLQASVARKQAAADYSDRYEKYMEVMAACRKSRLKHKEELVQAAMASFEEEKKNKEGIEEEKKNKYAERENTHNKFLQAREAEKQKAYEEKAYEEKECKPLEDFDEKECKPLEDFDEKEKKDSEKAEATWLFWKRLLWLLLCLLVLRQGIRRLPLVHSIMKVFGVMK